MAAIFAYTCSCCGQRHEGSPSFGCKAPMHYEELSDEDKQSIATLTDDLCQIDHPEGADYFARVVLELPIHGVAEPFLWGVWVSLSQESFEKYTSTWGEHDESDSYFGWFSNHLPYYPNTVNLKTNVRPRNGGARPILELQPSDHPLAIHFQNGMTIQEAQQIAEAVLHGS
ncbi:MAG TPA: DUF2199 domain-containing protein [Candidatus Acidoferrales bacterium]|nr:DUF2199 domain-containing protein [Candidatus Acidoferrales bacterium]